MPVLRRPSIALIVKNFTRTVILFKSISRTNIELSISVFMKALLNIVTELVNTYNRLVKREENLLMQVKNSARRANGGTTRPVYEDTNRNNIRRTPCGWSVRFVLRCSAPKVTMVTTCGEFMVFTSRGEII